MSTVLPDQDARTAIETELSRNIIVEASAGTGKTTALVRRVMALVRTGQASLSCVVAVTFTEKAAGEMKLRLRTEIEKERARSAIGSAERARFEQALIELETAQVGTIHSFCAEILRKQPVLAGIDPLVSVTDENESKAIYANAFAVWYRQMLTTPGPGVSRILRRKSRDFKEGSASPRRMLFDAGLRLAGQRDFFAMWKLPDYEREKRLNSIMDELAALAALSPRAKFPDDIFAKGIRHIATTYDDIDRREKLEGTRDYDAIEESLRASTRGWQGKLWTYRGYKPLFAEGISRDEVLRKRDALSAEIRDVLTLADAELAALLQCDLMPLVQAYERGLAEAGKIDFLDLLVRAKALLVSHPEVVRELGSEFTHVLVDEFQDTDPLQLDLLFALTSEPETMLPTPGRFFAVGDPKQSIYRFRRADLELYQRAKKDIVEGGGLFLRLSTNFRSTPTIVSALNDAFEPLMTGDTGQADFERGHAFREQDARIPSIVGLPIPAPYSPNSGKVSSYYVEQSFPDAIGAFVEWLVSKSDWKVVEGGKDVPVLPRHICVLFRRFSSFGEDMTRGVIRSLEARRIAHVLVGGRSFHDREEVLASRNALCAIEWPDDEFFVYATLRGPFFALSDESLFLYRERYGSLRYQSTARGEEDEETRAALELLYNLHCARNQGPVATTLSALFESVRAFAGVAFWPAGEQALANLGRLLDRARRADGRGVRSFRAFVEDLENEADGGEVSEAQGVEEGGSGVRLMTVHKAKGLEFPIVILADPSCPFAMENASRYVDSASSLCAVSLCGASPLDLVEHSSQVLHADRQESVRLTYVAATRAKDALVVPVFGDGPEAGWTEPLSQVVYPEKKNWRAAVRDNLPMVFGEDSVLVRPDKCSKSAADSIRPGWVSPRAGSHRALWWDPAALELGKEESVGIRQQRVLAADPLGEQVSAGERAFAEWKTARDGAVSQGLRPAFCVRTVTAAKGEAKSSTVEWISLPRDAPRPSGKRFGLLCHKVLETAAFDADSATLEAYVAAVAHSMQATEDERRAALIAIRCCLALPLFREVREADEVRRETWVSLKHETGIVEGVVDMAFRQGNRWTVVDYKTDFDATPRSEEYATQVALYAQAIARATGGVPVRALIVSI